jgi:signal transduction histidine kinase
MQNKTVLICFLWGLLGFGQSTVVVDHLRKFEFNISAQSLEALTPFEKRMVSWQLDFLRQFETQNLEFTAVYKETDTDFSRFLFYLNQGDYLFYTFDDKNIEARESYSKALELALSLDDSQMICEALKRILNQSRHFYLLTGQAVKPYLDLLEAHAYDDLEQVHLRYYKQIFGFQYLESNLDKWNKAIEADLLDFAVHSPYHFYNGRIYYLLAAYYHVINNNEKAIAFGRRALDEYRKIPDGYASTPMKVSVIGLTRHLYYHGNFVEAERLLSVFDTPPKNKLERAYKHYRYYYQSLIDSINGDYRNGFANLMIAKDIEDVKERHNKTNLLKDLEAKYENKLKQKENDELKVDIAQEKKEKRLLAIIGTIIFVLGSTLAYFVVNNISKKKKLSEQQMQIEAQRVENLLREQELVSIDAMIEGQEKERQRVANELHDDLGSLMATVKLYFGNIKAEGDPALFKAKELLDQAYTKIRSIAHAKNSGVIGSQGLVPAVEKLAQMISGTNALEIEVNAFGMEERMENSLELTVFRIIQELLANMIKHAEADKSSIHLTQHDDMLNIIIEDNGKGFDIHKIPSSSDGMGLHSIEKRVEFLEGSFTVDSIIGQGTSIIIDIPV